MDCVFVLICMLWLQEFFVVRNISVSDVGISNVYCVIFEVLLNMSSISIWSYIRIYMVHGNIKFTVTS